MDVQGHDGIVPIQKGVFCSPSDTCSCSDAAVQTKTTPLAMTLSPDGESFAILSLPSLRLTTFHFLSGRLHRAYDESLEATQEMQQAGTAGVKLDSMEFGRRLAIERDLERSALEGVLTGVIGSVGVGTPAWDEGGAFVLYPTLLGIKGEYIALLEKSAIR